MRSIVGRIAEWAIDGPGSRFQGGPAVGVAFLLIMFPVGLNVLGMTLFGYAVGSSTYKTFTLITVIFWIVPALYLMMILILGAIRLIQAIWQLLVALRGAERR